MARQGLTKPEYARHAALKSVPNLIDRLSFEHRQIEHLWTELQRAHKVDGGAGYGGDFARLGDASQHELGRSLLGVLAQHEAVEDDALYPKAAQAMPDGWADHARAEHAYVREILDEVGDGDPEDEAVFAMYSQAFTRLLAHIGEEETILFPIMRLVLSKEELLNPPEAPSTDGVILSRSERLAIRSPQPQPQLAPAPKPEPEPEPEPKVIDLTAAEREAASEGEADGNVKGGSHGVSNGQTNGASNGNGNGDDDDDDDKVENGNGETEKAGRGRFKLRRR